MRHVLAGVLVALLACSLLWAALPFTDAFTNTNGTLLTAHSANWTVPTSTKVTIQDNAVGCSAGDTCYGRVNSETFANDQYGQCVVRTPFPNYLMGPGVRFQTSGQGGYAFVADDNEFQIYEYNGSGVASVLTSTAGTISAGDVLYFEAVGSTLTGKQNGTTRLTTTDATWTTGAAGVGGYNQVTTTTTRCDDFEGGNVSAGSSAPIRRRPIMMFFTLPEFAR